MPDPQSLFEDLKHEGLPVNPLPAAEVRRRGTRLRRRNQALVAAGALAVVAVIATPVAVLAGHGGTSPEPAPAPPVLTQPAEGWPQEVEVDLQAVPATSGVGFAWRDGPVVDDLQLCGRTVFSTRSGEPVGPPVATAGAVHSEAGTESAAGRTLAVYDDDVAAGKALDAIRTGVDGCREDHRAAATTFVYDPVDTTLPVEDSFVYTEQVRQGGLLSDLTVYQVARVGNALFLASEHTSAGGEQAVDSTVDLLVELSAPVLSRMCSYSALGCTGEESAPPIGEGAVSAIPDDFPLDRGLSAPEGDPLDGPSPRAAGVPPSGLCGMWPPLQKVERLAVTATGPEFRESRELVTFARTADAADLLDQARRLVPSCDGVPPLDRVMTELPATPDGADEVVTFSSTPEQGLGGGVYQLVRVGRAVYAAYVGGEYSPDTAALEADRLTSTTEEILPAMCTWTVEGC